MDNEIKENLNWIAAEMQKVDHELAGYIVETLHDATAYIKRLERQLDEAEAAEAEAEWNQRVANEAKRIAQFEAENNTL